MGSPSYEGGRDDDEGPVHGVTLSESFAVGVYEVTRGEWGRFVSETGYESGGSCWTYEGGEWKDRTGRGWRNPGFSQSDVHPVVCVNWGDARAYVEWLSSEAGEGYRMLSESEWEYVARGGSSTSRYWGGSESGQCSHSNGADSTLKSRYRDWKWSSASCADGYGHTSPVGSFRANGFGLHDVMGNVWEWVEDCWHESYRGAPGRAVETAAPVCCVAARGSAVRGTCVPRIATGSPPPPPVSGTTLSVFASPGRWSESCLFASSPLFRGSRGRSPLADFRDRGTVARIPAARRVAGPAPHSVDRRRAAGAG